MKYNPLIHHRRSIRLKGYDYSQAGMYFITLCCHNKKSLFGRVIDGEMILTEAGKIADNEWTNTLKLRCNVELDEFVIMPNHMHGIIVINGRAVLHTAVNNTALNKIMDGKSLNNLGAVDGNGVVNDVVDDVNVEGVCDCRAVLHTAINDNQAFSKPGDQDILDINKKPLQSPSQTVGAINRGYKSAVTRQINKLSYDTKKEYNNRGGFNNPSEDGINNPSEGVNNNPSEGGFNNPSEDGINNPSEGVFNNPSEGVFNTPQLPRPNKIVWQENYYEIIIRDEKAYQNISNYIKNNPSKWSGDKFYSHLNK